MGALSNLSRDEARCKIAADTARYLSEGGVIDYIEYDKSAETAARVGRWQHMGEPTLDDIIPEYDGDPMPDDLKTFGHQWDQQSTDHEFNDGEHDDS